MWEKLINKYRHKGVLVDSNLLIGYMIGTLNPIHLDNCRATKAFTPDDFILLKNFLGQFRKIITTPHVLTEVSNLSGKLPETLHAEFRAVFRVLIHALSEKCDSAENISKRDEFLRFGLADTAISMIAPGSYLVLTDEVSLAGLLQKRGADVVNFNHMRMIRMQEMKG